MTRVKYDLVVVGAGSGGYAAARTAREAGARVALVDHGPLGGLCILRGCMPSKAFLASSDAMYDAREARALGVTAAAIAADMPFIAARKRGLVRSFAGYRIDGIRDFPLYEGKASFLSPHELAVRTHPERSGEGCHPERSDRRERSRRTGEDVVLEAKNFIIATGSVVASRPIPGLAEAGALDSDAVLELERIPKSVVVLGGGYTACELGQFLARMGAKTTMIVRSGQLLTHQDTDVGTTVTRSFVEEGIDVVRHATLLSVAKRGSRTVVRFSHHSEHSDQRERSNVIPSEAAKPRVEGRRSAGTEAVEREISAEVVFNALGRIPNVEGLALEKAGVAYDPAKGIAVDAHLRTSNPHIFAVGDVTGEYLLVHVAIYQGEVAARNAVNAAAETADYRTMSAHAIFCDPQVAHVGKNEKALQAAKTPYVVGRYDFADHGKAMCLGKTKGFVKMMAGRERGEIVGATVVGAQGSELIHEVIVAMHYRATVEEFMRIPHLHPTLAEIWTYPAEECCAQLGRKQPGDEQIELATSKSA